MLGAGIQGTGKRAFVFKERYLFVIWSHQKKNKKIKSGPGELCATRKRPNLRAVATWSEDLKSHAMMQY